MRCGVRRSGGGGIAALVCRVVSADAKHQQRGPPLLALSALQGGPWFDLYGSQLLTSQVGCGKSSHDVAVQGGSSIGASAACRQAKLQTLSSDSTPEQPAHQSAVTRCAVDRRSLRQRSSEPSGAGQRCRIQDRTARHASLQQLVTTRKLTRPVGLFQSCGSNPPKRPFFLRDKRFTTDQLTFRPASLLNANLPLEHISSCFIKNRHKE
jgi:hypothetical protein